LDVADTELLQVGLRRLGDQREICRFAQGNDWNAIRVR
jgi:hypothetical protein